MGGGSLRRFLGAVSSITRHVKSVCPAMGRVGMGASGFWDAHQVSRLEGVDGRLGDGPNHWQIASTLVGGPSARPGILISPENAVK